MNRTGLKYYLRALGIGIIVTALLMGYSQKGQAQMTDEEILQRAAQLGMTESQGVLAELAATPPETNPTLQSAAGPTESPAPTSGEDPAESPAPASGEDPAESPAPISGEDPAESPTPISGEDPAESPAPISGKDPAVSPTPIPAAEPEKSPAPTAEPVQSPAPDSTEAPAENDTSDSAGEVVTLVVNRGESSVTVSKSLEELGLVEDYRSFDRYLCDNGYDHSICSGTHEIPLGAAEEEIARIICKLQ